MKNLKELLMQYETCLQNIAAPILSKLQEGVEYDKIEKLLCQSNIVNSKLSTLYNWRNGIYNNLMSRAIEEIELFPDGIMFSLEDALSRYKLYTEIDNIWGKKLFPIFTNGSGDYFLFDFDKTSESSEMILLYAPSLLLSEEPEIIYDSLESLFETTIDCVQKGAYCYNPDSTIDVDYDLKYEISAKHNPKSVYWDDYR